MSVHANSQLLSEPIIVDVCELQISDLLYYGLSLF
jgi:hypothetical protein